PASVCYCILNLIWMPFNLTTSGHRMDLSQSCVASPTKRSIGCLALVRMKMMKYHVILLIVLILVHPSCSSERSNQSRQQTAHQAEDGRPTLNLGMSHSAALEIIRECGGQDI